MGNSNSFTKKFEGNSANKVVAKSVDESDDETEHLEVEVYECCNGESEADVKNRKVSECKTVHAKYIPIEKLIGNDENASLQLLPEDIRHESTLEYIRVQEKLVVHIRENSKKHVGTGCVYFSSDTLEEYLKCPLQNCNYNKGQAHKCYGGMIVYTNKHVVLNNSAAGVSKVNFFYYNPQSLSDEGEVTERSVGDDGASSLPDIEENSNGVEDVSMGKKEINANGGSIWNGNSGLHRGVTAYGFSIREDQQNKDLVGLRILYHDPELYTTLKKYSDLRLGIWSKIPENIKSNMKKRAIIISHPHGDPKKVSFGELCSLEEDDMKIKGRKVTKYNAATCSGSSGAPVLTGRYSYRPFVHSCKGQKSGLGFSYSY